jgi:hypothetical protein
VIWEMVGVEGMLVALKSLSAIKKGTSPSNRMIPFWSIYDNSFDTKCPGQKPKK